MTTPRVLSRPDDTVAQRAVAPRSAARPHRSIDAAGAADLVERFGVGAVPPADLLDLALAGRAVGVAPEVADLLVDTSAPEPVRQRAYGYIALRVAHRTAR